MNCDLSEALLCGQVISLTAGQALNVSNILLRTNQADRQHWLMKSLPSIALSSCTFVWLCCHQFATMEAISVSFS